MQKNSRAFSLLELMVVIAIIALLVGLALPALSRGRENTRTLTCLSRLRELSRGWQIYADENDGALVAYRMANQNPPDPSNPQQNWYDVGNGLKIRPRWVATMGAQVGIYAFNKPSTSEQRQDYDNEVYQCPTVPQWVDERNYAYGYNYQFLGNGRNGQDGRFRNFPVFQSQIRNISGTVIAADSMGTAAGFPTGERRPYNNNGTDPAAMGNHGSSLDPPRLTRESDRGPGDSADDPRIAVDPRHRKMVNAVFGDSHGETKTPYELGYRITAGGCYADADPNEECEGLDDGGGGAPGYGLEPGGQRFRKGYELQEPPPDEPDLATNRFFSGTGRDDDPPVVWP